MATLRPQVTELPASALLPYMLSGPTVVDPDGLATDAPQRGSGLFHLTHLITARLSPDNYLLWHVQLLPLLRSRHPEGYIDGSFPCPP
jgi:hypothetical protein